LAVRAVSGGGCGHHITHPTPPHGVFLQRTKFVQIGAPQVRTMDTCYAS